MFDWVLNTPVTGSVFSPYLDVYDKVVGNTESKCSVI